MKTFVVDKETKTPITNIKDLKDGNEYIIRGRLFNNFRTTEIFRNGDYYVYTIDFNDSDNMLNGGNFEILLVSRYNITTEHVLCDATLYDYSKGNKYLYIFANGDVIDEAVQYISLFRD